MISKRGGIDCEGVWVSWLRLEGLGDIGNSSSLSWDGLCRLQ